MNDNDIREFFHENRPTPADRGTFNIGLHARLNAVEEVKRLHDAEVARCRRTALVTFAAGLLLGALLVVVALLHPVALPHLPAAWLSTVMAFLAEWKEVIELSIALTAIVLGLAPWRRSQRLF